MPLFDHFDLLAPLYDRLIRPPQDDLLAVAAGLPTSGRLLDVGGGTGRIAHRLVERAGLVVVADASLKMLAQARKKDGLHLVGSHAERLPFPDGSFDRIVIVDAYHHLEHQTTSLGELWRVLAAGGRLVVEEPDIRLLPVRFMALAEKMALMQSHFVQAEHIAASLSALGARVTVQRDRSTAWVIGEKSETLSGV